MKKSNNIYYRSLKNLRKVKYKDKNFFSNKFYEAFKTSRNINNNSEFNDNKKLSSYQKNDFLLKKLLSIKKNPEKNSKFILEIMKKFEINLILRKSYNKQFKKRTNQETSLLSYLLLSFSILKLKRLDDLQKLNFILKINDYLIFKLHFKKNIFPNEIFKHLLNLINVEKKMIKKYEI